MPIPDFEADLSSVLDQILRIIGCYSEICGIKHDLTGMINSVLISQMITQGLWWDDSPLKGLINQKIFDQLKLQGISILPQILRMKTLTPELQFIKDRILIYQVSKKEINENKTILNLEITRLSGNIGANVISPHFLRKQIQSMFILIGNPETNEMYCHRRIQLKKDKMIIQLKANEVFDENSWIFLFSDAYIGVDQMYSIDQTFTASKVTMKKKERKNDSKKQKMNNGEKKEINNINDDIYQQACEDNYEESSDIFFWGSPDEFKENDENHEKSNAQFSKGNNDEQRGRQYNNRGRNGRPVAQQRNGKGNNNENKSEQQDNRGNNDVQRGRQQNYRGRNNTPKAQQQNNRGNNNEQRNQQQNNKEQRSQQQVRIEKNNGTKGQQQQIKIERKSEKRGKQQRNIFTYSNETK